MFCVWLMLILISPPQRGGVVNQSSFTTPSAPFRNGAILLVARPPLLGEEGKKEKHPAIKAFEERVEDYIDLRKKIEGTLPSLSKKEEDPAEIIKHEKRLAAGIRHARAKAARGDVFIPPVQPILLKIIKQELSPKEGKMARTMALGEGNPKNPASPAKIDLSVNATYPSAAPLSTVPPSLLLALPTLPKALEYRFVGRHLILYDVKANLIVDILPDAIR